MISPIIRHAIRCGNEPYADDHICETCDDEIADVTTIRKRKPNLHQCRPCHDGKQPTEKQPFERYPELAAIIEDLGWKASGISLMKWDRLLTSINAAIVASCMNERERCSSIAAVHSKTYSGHVLLVLQDILDRIAFPEKQ